LSKYKPGDQIIYKHPSDNDSHIGRILSIGDEDNYWIEWNNDPKWVTDNSIEAIDTDKYVHLRTPVTEVLYGN
jgi:hypothetical protein